MKYFVLLLLSLASQIQAANWPLDDIADTVIARGTAKVAGGVSGQSLVLDGASLIELNESAQLTGDVFTVSVWFNPYDLADGQQMLAGKNRYSRNERQWSLTIEPDGKLKAHLHQKDWSTISCDEPLVAGQWHRATLVVQPNMASLFLNGKPAGEVKLQMPISATAAPITLGGIWDQETVRQPFHGALDEFSYQPRAWSAKEIAAAYRPVSSKHEVPKLSAGLPLWDDAQEFPKAAELPLLKEAEFHVLKQKRPDEDGCKWTLGVGLAWHKGLLYASYGFNKGHENTPTEEAHVRVSGDGGKTWNQPVVMDPGEANLGVSHGVFLSHGGQLWAFMGAFYDKFQRTHTRAYRLNETSGQWDPHGVVIDNGFWPMQQPLQMADGNWIMAGFRVASGFGQAGNLPAVAISKGDDFTKWDLVVIPAAPNLGSNLWGESTVIVESKRILNIARYGNKAIALLSVSEDHGRSWTPAAPSNLPMATSKPYAGTLSTGQPYLVCTTTADTGGTRSPLTIAVGRPGESVFSKVFLVRTSVFEGTPGVSDPKADFSYPYAVEHEGKLYIGYTHKSHAANELAVIPIDQLRVEHRSALAETKPPALAAGGSRLVNDSAEPDTSADGSQKATEAVARNAREEAELEQKYQSWVAELTPARQAWQRTLQSQLGDFYLPIHKREKVAGKSNAWDFVDDDPALPRVLLIGDSVSRGYTLAVRKALAGKLNVHRAPANCGSTSSGLSNIDVWLGDGNWDLIHFNFGIHDRNTPIADYTQRLDQIVQRMQKTGAKLIWASTTPIPDAPDKKQTAASIVERNKAAAELMRQHGVATNDLFNAVTPHLAEMQNPNDVHFNGKGYDFLGETVAKAIEAELLLAESNSEPIDIDVRRELFVDDLIIGKLAGTQLKMHEPHRLRRMPQRPFGHYATVLSDGEKLRLYYRGDKIPGAHWRNGWGKYHEGEVTLYAESSDGGIQWTTPDLGIHKVPQLPKGNVVVDMSDDTFLVTHNFTPFIDTRSDVPDHERYKALGGGRYPPENWGGWKTDDERRQLRDKYGPGGLKAFASADGLNWRLLKKEPVIAEELGSFDSQNGAFWSEAEQQYVCYFRWFDEGRRAIRRSTSKDFLNWTEPVNMQANEPGEHLYTSCTHPYFRAPHIYVALPTRFQARQGAITDIVFMATRPGNDRFHRHFKEAFIRPGLGLRGWGNRANYITLNVVQTSSTEMSMFMYGGAQYVLRLDGFISINAGFEQGEFVTKPLKFSGDKLEINYSTAGAGEIRVELQDADGQPLPGYELSECDAIKGDAISGIVTWKENSDLSELAGKPVRVRFVMNEADLYALGFPEATK